MLSAIPPATINGIFVPNDATNSPRANWPNAPPYVSLACANLEFEKVAELRDLIGEIKPIGKKWVERRAMQCTAPPNHHAES